MSVNIYKPPINFNESGDSTTPITRLNAVDPLTYDNRTSDLTIKAANENNYGVITTGNQIIRGNKNFIDGITVDSLSLNNLNVSSGKITKDPENETDIVNKKYVGSTVETIKEETNKEISDFINKAQSKIDEINSNISYLKDINGETNQKEMRLNSIFDWNYSNNGKLIVKALYSTYKNKYILKFSKETYLMYFTTSAYTTNKLFISFYNNNNNNENENINKTIYDLMPNSFEILCQIKYNSNFKSRIINFKKGNYTFENAEGTTENHIGYKCTTDFNLEDYKGNGCKFLEDRFFNCYFDNQDLTNIDNIETKNINLTTGTIETTPIKENDIINKKYLDSSMNTTITTINNLSDSMDTMNNKLSNIEAGIISESTINNIIDNKINDTVKYKDNKYLECNNNEIKEIKTDNLITNNLNIEDVEIGSETLAFDKDSTFGMGFSSIANYAYKYSDSTKIIFERPDSCFYIIDGEQPPKTGKPGELDTRAAISKLNIIGSDNNYKFLGFHLNNDSSTNGDDSVYVPYTPNGSIVLFDDQSAKYFKLRAISTNYENHKFYNAGSFAYFLDIDSAPNISVYIVYYDLLNSVSDSISDIDISNLYYSSEEKQNKEITFATTEHIYNFVPLKNKELFILFDDNQFKKFKIFNIKIDNLNNDNNYDNINHFNHYTEITTENTIKDCAMYYINNIVHILMVDSKKHILHYKYDYNNETYTEETINDYEINEECEGYEDYNIYQNNNKYYLTFYNPNNKEFNLFDIQTHKLYTFKPKENILFNKYLNDYYVFTDSKKVYIIDLKETINLDILKVYTFDYENVNNIDDVIFMSENNDNNIKTINLGFCSLISNNRIEVQKKTFYLSFLYSSNGIIKNLTTEDITTENLKTSNIESNFITSEAINGQTVSCSDFNASYGLVNGVLPGNGKSVVNVDYLDGTIEYLKDNYISQSYRLNIEEINGVKIDAGANFVLVSQFEGCNLVRFNIQPFKFDITQIEDLNVHITLKTDVNNVKGEAFKNNINLTGTKNAKCLIVYQRKKNDFSNYNPMFLNQTMQVQNNPNAIYQIIFKLILNTTEITGHDDEFYIDDSTIIKIFEVCFY